MSGRGIRGRVGLPGLEAHAYTDGASTGSRGPGGYGTVIHWEGKTKEISGGEQDTTNLRMEITAACVALETIDEGHLVSVYSDSLLPRQLHAERLVQEVARERMAQLPR